MNSGTAKQQIAEKIKNAEAILVALSKSPSVDELAAALGLTMMLNDSKRHTTAIFSGDIPPALSFLEPEKTFENTVDSLRDFIVALDKEKADHLRLKTEGDVVKVYITPYRTTISEDDLEFSQGDYNVDLVLALGVTDQSQLDAALEAHGKIFHDATVASLSVGAAKSTLGSIDWYEKQASSLSEMIVSLGDTLKESLQTKIEEPVATALLTGIVASTERFSNEKTSPKVMSIAAQLMAAGANQQLIASNLQVEKSQADGANSEAASTETVTVPKKTPRKQEEADDGKVPEETVDDEAEPVEKDPSELGQLTISHEKEGTLEEIGAQVEQEQQHDALTAANDALEEAAKEVSSENQADAAAKAEAQLAEQLESVATPPAATPSVEDLQKDLAAASADVEKAAEDPTVPSLRGAVAADQWKNTDTPAIGGTLNATTEQARADKQREEASSQNHTILSHSGAYVGDQLPTLPPVPMNGAGADESQQTVVDPSLGTEDFTAKSEKVVTPPSGSQTLADLDTEHRSAAAQQATPASDARQDIEAALQQAASTSAPSFPPVPTLTPEPLPAPTSPGTPPASPVGLPPLPDFSTLPPLPPVEPGSPFAGPAPLPTIPTSETSDPGQFKIPG